MRILYHHRTQGRGAEGLHVSRIVLALREMGHEVTVVSPPGIDPLESGGGPAGRPAAPARGLSAAWRWVAARAPGPLFELAEVAYNLPAYLRLRRVLARDRFDLVYERYAFYLLAGALAARRAGVPFVLEANEVNGVAARNRRQFLPRLCGRFERALFRRCAAIHAVSSHLGERIVARGVPPARVHVTPNAFDVRDLAGCSRSEALAHALGLAGSRVIGFVGWFANWDRLDFLVDVFASLRQGGGAPVKLLLVGDGPMVPRLRAQAERLGVAGRVVFTGPVARSEVYRHMALLDVGVLPHSNEFGSPVAMFELMGLRIPLVAPRLGPILDVHRDGTTALLFDPLDGEQCRRALEKLLLDRPFAAAMAERAHRKLLAEHTWQRNAQRILESLPPQRPPARSRSAQTQW